MKEEGYDCVIIPFATKAANNADLKASEFCGRALATNLGALGGPMTICSKLLNQSRVLKSFQMNLLFV